MAGLKARAATPIEESMPMMLKLSFTEIGRPWRDPRVSPVRAKCESNWAARARAAEKSGSVKQLVN